MTRTQDLVSRKLNLEAELSRAETKLSKVEAEARKAEWEQLAVEKAVLEQERRKVIPPLQKDAKTRRAARLKTELLLKFQREAENQALQELAEKTDQFNSRLAQIARLLQ